MSAFADDLAWLCTKLALVWPVMVGHSMGITSRWNLPPGIQKSPLLL